MVHRLKTTHSGAYRFPRYLEDQDFYYYSTESDEHHGASEEGSGANSASEQASPLQSLSCQMMSQKRNQLKIMNNEVIQMTTQTLRT
jgi:hypothetical protein